MGSPETQKQGVCVEDAWAVVAHIFKHSQRPFNISNEQVVRAAYAF